jgi:hypothetical protein
MVDPDGDGAGDLGDGDLAGAGAGAGDLVDDEDFPKVCVFPYRATTVIIVPSRARTNKPIAMSLPLGIYIIQKK